MPSFSGGRHCSQDQGDPQVYRRARSEPGENQIKKNRAVLTAYTRLGELEKRFCAGMLSHSSDLFDDGYFACLQPKRLSLLE